MTPEQVQFNKEFNAMRTSVERAFRKVVQCFAYVDVKPSMKLLEIPVGRIYKVAVILANWHTCVHITGVTGAYFRCDLPSLETYVLGFAHGV